MGVKNLTTVFKALGIMEETIECPPGTVIAIDAMMSMTAFARTVESEYIAKCSAAAWPHSDPKNADVVKLLTLELFKPSKKDFTDANGAIKLPCLVYSSEPTAKTHPFVGAMREAIVRRLSTWLCNLLNAGISFILVWDPSVAGGARTATKLPRVYEPGILRPIDNAYIFVALKALGFPTIVGWTEGEKVCCAIVRAGAAQCVLSGDTDCYILGATVVGEKIYPRPGLGNGAILEKVVVRKTLEKAIDSLGPARPVDEKLLDMAVFLGNDFNLRERMNGPAKLVKRLETNSSSFVHEMLNCGDPEKVKLVQNAVDFFTITPTDINLAVAAANDAMSTRGENPQVLALLGIGETMNHVISMISRGPLRSVHNRQPVETLANEQTAPSDVQIYE